MGAKHEERNPKQRLKTKRLAEGSGTGLRGKEVVSSEMLAFPKLVQNLGLQEPDLIGGIRSISWLAHVTRL